MSYGSTNNLKAMKQSTHTPKMGGGTINVPGVLKDINKVFPRPYNKYIQFTAGRTGSVGSGDCRDDEDHL